MTCWWDPTGHRLAECEIDLRPRGAFRFVNRQFSGTHQFAGVYREIAPPHYLVFEAMGAVGRVILEQIGGKTRLTVRIECGAEATIYPFLTLGLLFVLAGGGAGIAVPIFAIFIAARIVHSIVYLKAMQTLANYCFRRLATRDLGPDGGRTPRLADGLMGTSKNSSGAG